MTCNHQESDNPRKQGWCEKCGKEMPTQRSRSLGVARRRDVELEREITRQAARGYMNPERLIEIAENRAATLSGEYVTDPMLIQPGRNRIQDAREEALDARNHLVWWLDENIGHEDAPRVMRALQHFMLAFNELEDEL